MGSDAAQLRIALLHLPPPTQPRRISPRRAVRRFRCCLLLLEPLSVANRASYLSRTRASDQCEGSLLNDLATTVRLKIEVLKLTLARFESLPFVLVFPFGVLLQENCIRKLVVENFIFRRTLCSIACDRQNRPRPERAICPIEPLFGKWLSFHLAN